MVDIQTSSVTQQKKKKSFQIVISVILVKILTSTLVSFVQKKKFLPQSQRLQQQQGRTAKTRNLQWENED